MGGGGGEAEGTSLEFTPTWVVAAVCTVIVSLSLAAERLLHYTGKVTFFLFFFLFLSAILVCISLTTKAERKSWMVVV